MFLSAQKLLILIHLPILLIYYIKNGTIQKDIRIGDTLVTYNDKVMLKVVDLNQLKRTITVKVMYGAYADLQDKTSNNPDLYKVKYYKSY